MHCWSPTQKLGGGDLSPLVPTVVAPMYGRKLLTNEGGFKVAGIVRQWDRYLVPGNIFLVLHVITARGAVQKTESPKDRHNTSESLSLEV